MNVFFRRIHLYLSFAAGLVILMSCLTGAVMVFQTELEHTFMPRRYYVEPSGHPLPLADLQKAAQEKYPGTKVNNIKVYGDADRSVEINLAAPGKKEGGNKNAAPQKSGKDPKEQEDRYKEGKGAAIKGVEKKAPMTTVFLNPYNGQVLDVQKGRVPYYVSG